MNNDDPNVLEHPTLTESKTRAQPGRPGASRHTAIARPRKTRLIPVSEMFSVRPGVDMTTLLSQATQNLQSLSVLAQDFVHDPAGPQHARAVMIHQLTGLTELLVGSALGKTIALQSAADATPSQPPCPSGSEA